MSNRVTYTLIAIFLGIFWGGLLYWAIELAPPKRYIDCSLAEISPDYSPAIKAACRERRMK